MQVDKGGYQEPASIPKASADVVNTAIGEAVVAGKVWLLSGPASLLAEPIPAGVLTPGAKLRSGDHWPVPCRGQPLLTSEARAKEMAPKKPHYLGINYRARPCGRQPSWPARTDSTVIFPACAAVNWCDHGTR